jgi:hypothetical protein
MALVPAPRWSWWWQNAFVGANYPLVIRNANEVADHDHRRIICIDAIDIPRKEGCAERTVLQPIIPRCLVRTSPILLVLDSEKLASPRGRDPATPHFATTKEEILPSHILGFVISSPELASDCTLMERDMH